MKLGRKWDSVPSPGSHYCIERSGWQKPYDMHDFPSFYGARQFHHPPRVHYRSSNVFLPLCSAFSPSTKSFLNSNSTRIVDPQENQLELTWLPSLNIIIYLFILSNPSYLSNKIVAVFFMFCFRIRFLRGGGLKGILLKKKLCCMYLSISLRRYSTN